MKIAIMTLPLWNNYGGILQAYALQKTLIDLGHKCEILHLDITNSYFSMDFYRFIKLKIKDPQTYKDYTFKLRQFKDCKNFIKTNLITTRKIKDPQELKDVFISGNYSAIVLGSDQVFRPSYFIKFLNDFSLGFVSGNVIKLAYAASFGGDKFDNYDLDINIHKANLAKFKAISVREKSGVEICKKEFNLEATHVLDPTLLAKKEIFENVIDKDFDATKGKILVYILDENAHKLDILNDASKKYNKDIFKISEKSNRVKITQWISAFKNADFIITDSFHGCVFSIIFQKDFFVFINESRGSERFYSLFEMFGLSKRIINQKDDINLDKKISWQDVENHLQSWKKHSLDFLVSNLKESR